VLLRYQNYELHLFRYQLPDKFRTFQDRDIVNVKYNIKIIEAHIEEKGANHCHKPVATLYHIYKYFSSLVY